MKSAAESAFERQFGFGTTSSSKEKAAFGAGSKDSKVGEGEKEKAASGETNGRKGRCRCDCPFCGEPAKASIDEEDEEKSTIGEGQLEDIVFTPGAQKASPAVTQTDRAVKLQISRRTTAVHCPQCHTRLHLQHGGSAADEESDETDSLYEIKDAYENWSGQRPPE